MTREEFWQLIEQSRTEADQYARLETQLRSAGKDTVISFEDNLRRVMLDASSFPMLAAAFVINSYVSDDGFEDFRAWLVSQGQQRFEAALRDPESMSDWLPRDSVDDLDGEPLHMMAYSLLDESGDLDELFDRVDVPRDADFDVNWPESKTEYHKLFPRLVDKFWNQKRINDMHSD